MSVAPDHVLRNRPNKVARGMTRTLYRSGHKLDDDALTLSVHGTCDRLRSFVTSPSAPAMCECCGQRTFKRRVLSKHGRVLLARFRRYCGQGKTGYFARPRLP